MQLVLTPAPAFVHTRARRLLKRRERSLNQRDRRDRVDPGMDSVVEAKELKGALETQHRSLLYFDLRIAGESAAAVRRVAGPFTQLRSENDSSGATCGCAVASTPEGRARAAERAPGLAPRCLIDLGARHALAAAEGAQQARADPARGDAAGRRAA